MNARALGALVVASLFALPASANADYAHVVSPGETLTSVATQDGLTVAALAAANGISPNAQLIAGSVLQIPPRGSQQSGPSTAATTTTEETASSLAHEPDGDEAGAARTTSSTYLVKFGDTLSSIAAQAGTTVATLAATNGINPNDVLLAGTTLTLPGGSATSHSEQVFTTAGTGTGATPSTAAPGPPYPTNEHVSGSEIATIASSEGVPSSLAQAIGWQESGWSNDVVSKVGAVGVMQVVPTTWQWIQAHLASVPLAPASASDNVRAGVLLLHALLAQTGSDSEAAAGYYQGLASVRQFGMYPDTRRYVADVMALQSRFGG